MADVVSELPPSRPPSVAEPGSDIRAGTPVPHFEVIELLFFAYRAFIGGPDRILADYGFGRAHHRVLHFVSRNPGMSVTELLEVLKITKQSLGRVLKQLVDTGFIEQRPGPADRRQRLLYATAAGRSLAGELAGLQSDLISKALQGLPPSAEHDTRRFLAALAAMEDRGAPPTRNDDEDGGDDAS
ncbi:MarR family winged helix-turn-helix transcriptional regulator [Segnochrobactrum spirostomi]|uniref:Winged helix-turn-helix transcriptional regulator n=1 Tax=Segnochrobactrum spirostomi TaxID=2608987 RepID=A0A6A7Y4Y2_9HYPH|nr:MarR family winged helix-turn-helix transcriptional regulator [Segnochrobactrum spirostomi]MQT13248.1 winged helix-turn-helix transcriptional regulator [Segnochrobactrum spirostomi]